MIKAIAENFIIYGDYISSKPFGSGHINDTRLVTFKQAGLEANYIFRRINKYVFKDPKAVINNTLHVTEHIRNKLKEEDESDISRHAVTLVMAKNEKYYYIDTNGDHWSVLLFIKDAYTANCVESIDQANKSAKAFGKFTKQITDLDIAKIKETIPNFHNFKNRLENFDSAVKTDKAKRIVLAAKEIATVDKYRNLDGKISDLLSSGVLPIRIVHNDTKINNIMLDAKTGEGLAVIDLDTVMPGTILFDFGDMIRSSTSPVAEDEKDIQKVKMRIGIFEAVVKGYLSELKDTLTKEEIENLVYGVEVIVCEQAIRFLTDYLIGDIYYTTDYEDHNLIRARNQFALLDSIQEQKEQMEEIIKKYI